MSAAPAAERPGPGRDGSDAEVRTVTGRRRRTATLVLARHGQTTWHAENRYAGVTDVDLTDTGRAQSQQLARWAQVQRPDALYTSPIRRARETAAPAAAATGLVPQVLTDLREVDFGAAEGLTLAEFSDRHPVAAQRFHLDPVDGIFPGAESPAAAAARGRAALCAIAAEHPGQTVLVVGHNTLTRLVLCSLLGIPLASYRRALPRIDNGTLTRIRLAGTTGAAAMLSFNVPLTG